MPRRSVLGVVDASLESELVRAVGPSVIMHALFSLLDSREIGPPPRGPLRSGVHAHFPLCSASGPLDLGDETESWGAGVLDYSGFQTLGRSHGAAFGGRPSASSRGPLGPSSPALHTQV